MEAISDLNTFAKILTAKGYDGYFHTQGAYAGKLKASISEYLAGCPKGVAKQELLLTCFLQWAGEDLPRIECLMSVKYLNGKFFLGRMETYTLSGQLNMWARLSQKCLYSTLLLWETIFGALIFENFLNRFPCKVCDLSNIEGWMTPKVQFGANV